MTTLAIIGGTGVDELDGLELTDSHDVTTPYGTTSRPVQEGRMGEVPLYFLQRHGAPQAIPPHLINYRANLWALRSLGVEDVVAINAVGGISAQMRPGCLLIPDQIIDYTWGREHTFDDGAEGSLMHIDFSEPYSGALRAALVSAAEEQDIAHSPAGVYGATQGPRLETAAEIRRMARDGCDVVGMTGMPEAALARELDMDYASVCMVVNPAPGLEDKPITLESMRAVLRQEAAVVRRLLGALLRTRYGA
jgi:5'-methylthioinosine phosphorylase